MEFVFFKNSEQKLENPLKQMEVKQFLVNSPEFKKMKNLVNKQTMLDFYIYLDWLEKSPSIEELLFRCSFKYKIEDNDNPIVDWLGRNNVNAMLYMGGFFSDKSNFNYLGLHFYESILEYMQMKRSNNLPILPS